MNSATFFDAIRKTLFGGKLSAAQVDGINGILQAMDEVGDGDQDTLAYALATAYHETGRRMVPVREGFATTDAGARRAVASLAAKRGPKSAPARYGKSTGPHGHAYYGRGHVQLTWMENYRKSSADAGTDLVANPDAMLDPKISARVLIRGIMDGRWNGQGKGISHYEGADDKLSDAEAEEARRLVNVKDKARQIAGYHRKFYDALAFAKWQKIKDTPVDAIPAPPKPLDDRMPPVSGVKPEPVARPNIRPTALPERPKASGVIPMVIISAGAVLAAAFGGAWQWLLGLFD